jgi:hypothetical protein
MILKNKRAWRFYVAAHAANWLDAELMHPGNRPNHSKTIAAGLLCNLNAPIFKIFGIGWAKWAETSRKHLTN